RRFGPKALHCEENALRTRLGLVYIVIHDEDIEGPEIRCGGLHLVRAATLPGYDPHFHAVVAKRVQRAGHTGINAAEVRLMQICVKATEVAQTVVITFRRLALQKPDFRA